MKWWGWGDPERRVELTATAVGAVRDELGLGPGDISEPVSIDRVSLPGARPIPKAVQVAAGEVLDGPVVQKERESASFVLLRDQEVGEARASGVRGRLRAGHQSIMASLSAIATA